MHFTLYDYCINSSQQLLKVFESLWCPNIKHETVFLPHSIKIFSLSVEWKFSEAIFDLLIQIVFFFFLRKHKWKWCTFEQQAVQQPDNTVSCAGLKNREGRHVDFLSTHRQSGYRNLCWHSTNPNLTFPTHLSDSCIKCKNSHGHSHNESPDRGDLYIRWDPMKAADDEQVNVSDSPLRSAWNFCQKF